MSTGWLEWQPWEPASFEQAFAIAILSVRFNQLSLCSPCRFAKYVTAAFCFVLLLCAAAAVCCCGVPRCAAALCCWHAGMLAVCSAAVLLSHWACCVAAVLWLASVAGWLLPWHPDGASTVRTCTRANPAALWHSHGPHQRIHGVRPLTLVPSWW